ncbi:sialate O-acetylesterase, partial [Escherichia coli]|nr:sialate O-acetylesterase [Escherichia coli]
WQPYGSALISTAGYGAEFIQPVVSEGSISSPEEPGNRPTTSAPSVAPEYYYVIALAGQSNGMSYGEGLPLPDTFDSPDPRIKQLARRSTVTPGGAACIYNDIIPADHCLHDVEDMTGLNHPKADLSKGQYGCVGQGLHIAKKLLPFIPANAGILLVPCCRGGSAFTTGTDGTYSDASGASENSTRWGVDKPLYKDLIGRTKAALKKNPKNVLFAVVWMQGESDFDGTPANHAAQFGALVDKFRADLADMAGQCVGGSAGGVPWICGDTTYFWKQKNESTYQTVYGSYKNKTEKNIHFVPFMTDENGVNVPTNKPEEDPDIPDIGYYGSKWRTDRSTWTSQDRASHFSSWARRGIISDRLATAILSCAGKSSAFVNGTAGVVVPDRPVTTSESVIFYDAKKASDNQLKPYGWDGMDGRRTLVDDSGNKALRIEKRESTKSWSMFRDIAADKAKLLLEKGGEIAVRFKIPENVNLETTKNKYAFGLYWKTGEWPGEGGEGYLSSFFVQTDKASIDVAYHHTGNQQKELGTFGAFDHDWHTLAFKFKGGNSINVTPVLDGQDGAAFDLVKWTNTANELNRFVVTDITANAETYPVLIDTVEVKVNSVDTAA